MASKSFTALPSVVSVVAEKTVIAMRCHTRGFEKVLWPVTSIILTFLAFACFAVAAGTPNWVQINLTVDDDADPDKGYITFGIFRGSHVIELRQNTIVENDQQSYYIFQQYTNVMISRLYATFVFSLIAMILCIFLVVVTFINSYQTVTTWWRGPPMMYILSIFISFCAFIAIGLFADFYLWDLDTESVLIDSYNDPVRPGTNSLNYDRTPTLHYSFGLQVGGSFLPVLVLLISWRLVLLLPTEKTIDVTENEHEVEMQETHPVQTSLLPTTNMMMSMQAAAGAPPIPVSNPTPSSKGKIRSQPNSFVTGEGGLLY